MKRLCFILIIFCLLGLESKAQKILTNSVTQTPVGGALVMDSEGHLLGITKEDGLLTAEMLSVGKIDVVHSAFEPVEFQINGGAEENLEMTPIVSSVSVRGKDKPKADYVKLRGWQRNYQFENKNLTFITEGVVEYFIPINGKGKIKYRTEGLRQLMAKGMTKSYDVTKLNLFERQPLVAKDKKVVSKTADATVWKIMKAGQPFGIQYDMPGGNHSLIEIPDAIAGDTVKFKFFVVKFKFNYISVGQMFTPYREDGKYTMGDLSLSHTFYSVNSSVKKKEVVYNYVEDFYTVEAEYLTKDEAKRQMKIKNSKEAVELLPNVPALSKALMRAKHDFVPSK